MIILVEFKAVGFSDGIRGENLIRGTIDRLVLDWAGDTPVRAEILDLLGATDPSALAASTCRFHSWGLFWRRRVRCCGSCGRGSDGRSRWR